MPRLAFFYLLVMPAISIVALIATRSQPRKRIASIQNFLVTSTILRLLTIASLWYVWSFSTWEYRTLVAGILSTLYVFYGARVLIRTRHLGTQDRPPRSKLSVVARAAFDTLEVILILALAFIP